MSNANANIDWGKSAKVSECIQCGYCCMRRPCPYGSVDEKTGWCVHLVVCKETKDYKQYACGKYDEIMKVPDAWLCPAFGSGCSSTLFNTQRDIVYVGLMTEKEVDT